MSILHPSSLRRLLLSLLLGASIQAIDLTVNSGFTTNEDVPVVFSYAQLLSKCTVSETPDRIVISFIYGNGTLQRGASTSGPWTAISASEHIVSGEYVRFLPLANYHGSTFMMAIIAGLGGDLSAPGALPVTVQSINDAPTASSATDATLTEDTPKTWTHADLTTLLNIQDVEGDPYRIVVTTIVTGTSSIAVNQSISDGDSITWTPPLNLFTRADEPDIQILKFRVDSTLVSGSSTVVTLSVRLAAVPEEPSGVATVLTSLSPLRCTAGTETVFTYDQIWKQCKGLIDPDRNALLFLELQTSPGEGTLLTTILNPPASSTYDMSMLPRQMHMWPGSSFRLYIPANAARGTRTVGRMYARADYSSTYSGDRSLLIEVRDPSDGTSGGAGGGGGGGGCGAGTAGLLLAIGACLRLRRERRRA